MTTQNKSAHEFAQALPESVKKSSCFTCLLTNPEICKGCAFAEYLKDKCHSGNMIKVIDISIV